MGWYRGALSKAPAGRTDSLYSSPASELGETAGRQPNSRKRTDYRAARAARNPDRRAPGGRRDADRARSGTIRGRRGARGRSRCAAQLRNSHTTVTGKMR